MATKLQVWNIKESDFPSQAEDSEKIRFILNYAVLAPSSWNAQPWIFKLHGCIIRIYHDRERLQRHRDPEGRENIISCGTALCNLCLALNRFGFKTETSLLPNPDEPQLMAEVYWTAGRPVGKDNKLFKAITRRHSYRRPFTDRPVTQGLIDVFRSAAALHGCEFIPVVYDSMKSALGGMICEGDKDLGADEETRKEYASWVRGSSRKGDGVPGYAMGLNPVQSILAPLTHRMFNYTDEFAHGDRALSEEAALLGVLTSKEDNVRAWLECGQALEQVLLSAASHEVQASFLNQPIPIPELRSRLQDLIGTKDYPQIILRLGYPKDEELPATPRRDLSEMLAEND